MKRILVVFTLIRLLFSPSLLPAVEVAPSLTDREIIERLTRLEEGLNGVEKSLRAEIRAVEQSLRGEIRANAEAIKQLRDDMNVLRTDMNAQFDRMVRLMLGIVGAFAALVAATIGFAIWDRRTMIRPFETKVKEIDEELSQNRQKLHAFLEALRALSQTDERVSEVLRRFHLL